MTLPGYNDNGTIKSPEIRLRELDEFTQDPELGFIGQIKAQEDPEAFAAGAALLRESIDPREIIDITDGTIAAQEAKHLEDEIAAELEEDEGDAVFVVVDASRGIDEMTLETFVAKSPRTPAETSHTISPQVLAHEDLWMGIVQFTDVEPEEELDLEEDFGIPHETDYSDDLLDELAEDIYEDEVSDDALQDEQPESASDEDDEPTPPEAEVVGFKLPEPETVAPQSARPKITPPAIGKRGLRKRDLLRHRKDYMFRKDYFEEAGDIISYWDIIRGKAEVLGTVAEYRQNTTGKDLSIEPIMEVPLNKPSRPTIEGVKNWWSERNNNREKETRRHQRRRVGVVIASVALTGAVLVGAGLNMARDDGGQNEPLVTASPTTLTTFEQAAPTTIVTTTPEAPSTTSTSAPAAETPPVQLQLNEAQKVAFTNYLETRNLYADLTDDQFALIFPELVAFAELVDQNKV